MKRIFLIVVLGIVFVLFFGACQSTPEREEQQYSEKLQELEDRYEALKKKDADSQKRIEALRKRSREQRKLIDEKIQKYEALHD